jgi:hypothetical protein
MKQIADVLADAREYQEKNGWWRGSLRGPNGRQVCMRGAILYSQGWKWGRMTREQRDLDQAVNQTLLQAIGPENNYWGSIEGWNDDNEQGAKNKQHVLDVFAKAEKIARTGFDPDAPDQARFDPNRA